MPVGEVSTIPPIVPLGVPYYLSQHETPHMWEEIADMPGEIFDLPDDELEEFRKVCEMNEEEYMMYMYPEQFNFA